MQKYQKWRYGINRPNASEGIIWNRFFDPLEYLTETNVSEKIKSYYYSAIKAELKAFNAKRFVNKNPKHCLRLRWLNSMFPDAYYIIIWRDPKAIINSHYIKMKKLWNEPQSFNYVHGHRGFRSIFDEFTKDGSKFDACINFYKHIISIMMKDIELVKDRTIELQYKDFVNSPKNELRKLYNFVGLPYYDKLDELLPEKLELHNDEKWKQLPNEEKEILEKIFPN